jgi:hypothetical protein
MHQATRLDSYARFRITTAPDYRAFGLSVRAAPFGQRFPDERTFDYRVVQRISRSTFYDISLSLDVCFHHLRVGAEAVVQGAKVDHTLSRAPRNGRASDMVHGNVWGS